MNDNEVSTEMIPAIRYTPTEEHRGFITKRNVLIVVALCIVALLAGGTIAALQNFSKYHQTVYNSAPKTQVSAKPTLVKTFTEPPKAALIARQLQCKRFKDGGGRAAFGVFDSGRCYIGSHKYGIDTFRTRAARNAWVKMAAPLGISPEWETANSVVYPSVNPSS